MRKLLALVAATMLASLVAVAPAGTPPVRAATGPKVVIIVGATGSTTATYRSYGDQIAAAAAKYTPNVVKVYSPNATWTKVKAAVYGASVVVYLGHGNGWPSPYTYDPSYTTKDGFGLNYDVNGDGKLADSELKYYGEPSIATLQPAPNAIVLLFHLCYASGNSEPGQADPTLTVAKQRVDNYAAAFLKAGARAVLANGHSHADYYISALFTTRQTIRDYFDHAPDVHGHDAVYASSRSAGYSFVMDPEQTGKYYRSITGNLALRTEDITGAGFADTSGDPAAMAVPGNASPVADGTPVYGSAADAAAALNPTGTVNAADRIRVDARESVVSTVDGSPVYRMHTDTGLAGWMPGSSLVPRDSLAPRVWQVTDGTGAFSPDGNGVQDTLPLSIRLSEPAAWTLRILDGDANELAKQQGTSNTAALTWAPAPGIPEGTYRWELEATDGWGNGPLDASGSLQVDVTGPAMTLGGATAASVPVFTPNGDGVTDTIGFGLSATEAGTATGTVRDGSGRTVATIPVGVGQGTATWTWDGRTSAGAYVADGTYQITFAAQDLAGNRSDTAARTVGVYGALGFAKANKTIFFPQDADRLATTAGFSFSLKSAATVTWTIVNRYGATVRTIKTDAALAAGSYGFVWNGRTDAGAVVPRGTYRSVVTATDGTYSATLSTAVLADAFRITVSDATPGRGQRITVTAVTAEGLSAAPKLRVYQPGISCWAVTMTKVATGTYRATITLKRSSTGTLKLKVLGTDSAGGSQYTIVSLPLH